MVKSTKRRDSKNRVLEKGEGYRKKEKRYYFSVMEKGKRKFIYANDLNTLRKRKTELLSQLNMGINIFFEPTLKDAYNDWMDNLTKYKMVRNSTRESYKCLYKSNVENTNLEKKKIRSITATDIEDFLSDLVVNRGKSYQTAKNLNAILYSIFKRQRRSKTIDYNPVVDTLKVIKKYKPTKTKEPLTEEEQDVFYKYLLSNKEYSHWIPLFVFMFEMGTRISECCGLCFSDIDFQNNKVYIRNQLLYRGIDGKSKYYVDFTKNGINRTLVLTKHAKIALELQMKHNLELPNLNINVNGKTDFVFKNWFGGLLSQETVNKALCNIVNKINAQIKKDGGKIYIPTDFTTHTFRKTCGTRLMDAGYSLEERQDKLGHRPQTTMNQRYSMVLDNKRVRANALYENYIVKNVPSIQLVEGLHNTTWYTTNTVPTYANLNQNMQCYAKLNSQNNTI